MPLRYGLIWEYLTNLTDKNFLLPGTAVLFPHPKGDFILAALGDIVGQAEKAPASAMVVPKRLAARFDER